jgi:phage terminase large subunit
MVETVDIPKYTIPKESFNKAFLPYLRSNARTEIFYGGGGSGKSYFLAQRDLLEIMGKKNNNILIMRKVAASNHNSTFADFKNVLNNWDNDFRKQDEKEGRYRSNSLSSYFKINNSKGDERIVFIPTGNEILFGGCKDESELEKIKGIRATNGPITKIRCEEFTEFTQRDYYQLATVRMRGETTERKRFTASMNPIYITHWIKTELMDKASKDTLIYEHENTNVKAIIDNPNLVILKTTHEDNKFYGEEERKELLKFKDIDKYYYDVYVLGNWGVLGNIVFSNYIIEDFDDNEHTLDNVFIGMDYGFEHASAIECGGYKDNDIYIFKEVYGKKWTDEDLRENAKNEIGDLLYQCLITADSAEPARIEEWQRQGFNIVGADKGPGSVKYGIDYLCSIPKIHIHRTNCPNLAREITMFKRREDKDGNAIDDFVKINDDTIAALRYGTESIWSNQNNVYYSEPGRWSLSDLGL